MNTKVYKVFSFQDGEYYSIYKDNPYRMLYVKEIDNIPKVGLFYAYSNISMARLYLFSIKSLYGYIDARICMCSAAKSSTKPAIVSTSETGRCLREKMYNFWINGDRKDSVLLKKGNVMCDSVMIIKDVT